MMDVWIAVLIDRCRDPRAPFSLHLKLAILLDRKRCRWGVA